jgi:apolipoprotein N-acyltransferase
MPCSLFAHGDVKSRKPLLPALTLIACVAAYGAQRLDRSWNMQGESFLAAMVQGNINQMQKWTPENRARIIGRYLDLSAQALELAEKQYGREADLLLWPETAMPFAYELSPELAVPLGNFVSESSIPLLFGAIGAGPDGSSYNRILLLDRRGGRAGHYDKEHLVPFGEYVPPGLYVPFASEFLQGTGFSPGNNERALRLPPKNPPGSAQRRLSGSGGAEAGNIALGPLICYEVIFPELAQKRVEQNAAILVSVSNDAWFERSSAPLQHLQLAAMRCIEQGRYMLRSTNTGISAALDPAGRILDPGPLFEPWVQIEAVRALEEKTFYHTGYVWINGVLLLLPFMLFIKALLTDIRIEK